MKVRTTTHFISTAIVFASVLSVFAAPTVVLASGNFLPLMRIKGIPANEHSQIKIHEIYQHSTGTRGTELPEFSEILNIRDMNLRKNIDMQPVRSGRFDGVLPITWPLVSDKPLSHVLLEFTDYSSTREIEFVDLLRIFNIEVIVTPMHEFKYPSDAVLIFEIRSIERAVLVELPMHLDLTRSSYFISNPAQVARELLFELERFAFLSDPPTRMKPWLKLIVFKGFEFADAKIEPGVAGAVQVGYELRLGSFSVDSGLKRLGMRDMSYARFSFNQALTN
ncbi:MAG: hypothetical protein OXG15_01255 [Gammaproteobacteria bacterium]|nr:hypothetical protein [Gammaproteobacteria bacterium]